MTKQLNFGVAQIGHLAGFGEHRIRSPAALFSAGERHHAVGAELVASFNDGDVTAIRVGARGELSLKALVGFAIVEPGHTAVPCLDLNQHLRQIAIRSRSGYQRNVRRFFENLVAFLLGHAAEHAKSLALLLEFLVIGQAMENFLLSFITNGASVVEHQPGFFDGGDLAVSLRNQRADDLFGVVGIHLAAESLEVESLLLPGRRGH